MEKIAKGVVVLIIIALAAIVFMSFVRSNQTSEGEILEATSTIS